jgi:ribosomal protein S18 acetylase RimI-like enzyme
MKEGCGSMTFVIQDAIPDDDEGIRYVQHQTWLATYPNEELGITKEAINARFAYPDGMLMKRHPSRRQQINTDPALHVWVAKEEQRIIGFCIALKEALNGHVRAIYILPAHQGRGIGKQLMQATLDWLGDDKPVTLAVAAYNTTAIAFYRRFSFVVNEQEMGMSAAHLPTGAAIPLLEMIRPRRA